MRVSVAWSGVDDDGVQCHGGSLEIGDLANYHTYELRSDMCNRATMLRAIASALTVLAKRDDERNAEVNRKSARR